jgi:hypothetical protein
MQEPPQDQKLQIEAIRSADLEKVTFIILQIAKMLEEQMTCSLDALEWLQRQIVRYIA